MTEFLNLTLRNSIRNLKFEIRNSRTRAFTLIELIVSVALLLVALSIALFAVIGTNGMIQKADARSSISESTRGVGEAIRRTIANAPVGAVTLLPDSVNAAAIQVKVFSDLQSGNTCTVIGRAIADTDENSGEEKYTIATNGTVIALLIYNVDSGGLCPTTSPIYQNRLTNAQAVVKAAQFSVQNVACVTITTSCVTKQLLRYSLTLEAAQKGSGGTSEARKPTLTIQEGLPVGLVNEATTVLKIETTSLPDAHAGNPPYSASVVVSGGMPVYNWTIFSGALPAGLSLSATTGVIGGTPNPPTSGNTYNFTVKVTDSANPANAVTKPLSIFVIDDIIAITTPPTLPGATVGANYTPPVQLRADRGINPANPCSCTWTIQSGALPAGLSLSNGGVISGNPAPGSAGVYSPLIRAAESNNLGNYAERTFSLTVSGTPQTLAITTLSLPNGTVGVLYSQAVTANGGSGSYSWSLNIGSGPLPPGLILSSSGTPSTTISGNPTTAGTYNFTVRVADGVGGVDTQALTIIIGSSGGGPPIGGGSNPF